MTVLALSSCLPPELLLDSGGGKAGSAGAGGSPSQDGGEGAGGKASAAGGGQAGDKPMGGGGANSPGPGGAGGEGPGPYPYDPSNFEPGTVAPGVDVVLDCGTSRFDSTTLVFDNWCDRPTPAVAVVEQANGVEVAVLSMRSFMLASNAFLNLEGGRPVLFAVYGDATIASEINAGGSLATPGPGGDQACTDSSGGAGGGNVSTGASGGGGGGFGTNGAPGGSGDGMGGPGLAGVARGTEDLRPLVGGCSGGTGGACPTSPGGAGGGAIQFSAAGALVLSAEALLRISGGNGANGCGQEGGGGGGGTGGAVLLEGATVEIQLGARITAHGGKGGNGAPVNMGGPGGAGGTGAAAAQAGSNSLNGAGGGGGGVGRIRINGLSSCTLDGTSSPAASVSCP